MVIYTYNNIHITTGEGYSLKSSIVVFALRLFPAFAPASQVVGLSNCITGALQFPGSLSLLVWLWRALQVSWHGGPQLSSLTGVAHAATCCRNQIREQDPTWFTFAALAHLGVVGGRQTELSVAPKTAQVFICNSLRSNSW